MATMIGEVYDAFRSIGATEEVARKAAEALSQTDARRADFEARLTTIQWMVGTNIGLTLLLLGKLLLMHS
jgi:hypothetical protein